MALFNKIIFFLKLKSKNAIFGSRLIVSPGYGAFREATAEYEICTLLKKETKVSFLKNIHTSQEIFLVGPFMPPGNELLPSYLRPCFQVTVGEVHLVFE